MKRPTCTLDPAAFHDFMATQTVRFGTLSKSFSVPDALSLLDAVVQRGGQSTLGAMGMAAAIVADVVIAFLRERSGHEDWETTREPEDLFDDPVNVQRHVIITSSLSVLFGDDRFPALAAKWLGIGASTEQQAAFYEALLSGRRVEAVVRKDAPATALRASVRGGTADAQRVRRQRRDPASFSLLDAVRAAEQLPPSAEFAVEARIAVDFAPLITRLRQAGYTRLADEVEEFLSIDRNQKAVMGDTRYRHLMSNMPLIRSFALEIGMQPPRISSSFPRSSITAPPTWRWDTPAKSRVAHCYSGAALEVFRQLTLKGLPFVAA